MREEVKIPDSKNPSNGTDWSWFESFVDDGGPAAAERLRRWNERRSGPQWDGVKRFLKSLKHDVLHRLELAEIEEIVGLRRGRPTTHALENLTVANRDFKDIADFSPPFAIEYLLHDCMETLGRVPRWTDVKRNLFITHRERYIEPFLEKYDLVSGSPETTLGSPYFATLQWRVGTAFYSFLREVHLLTSLRRKFALDVRYHVLADVEFKADLVAGDTLVALYLPNEKYRDDRSGRKIKISEANPGRKTIEVRIETHGSYTLPWMASQDSIMRLVQTLTANGCPRLSVDDLAA